MRGWVAMLVLAGIPACDLVFPPGGAPTDGGPPGTPDAEATIDAPPGTPDAEATIDAPPGTPDASSPADADVCTLACLGEVGNNGDTGCGPVPVTWCASAELATLYPYDLCGCTNDEPSLIVFDADADSMSLAFLAQFSDTYYVWLEGSCYPSHLDCPIDALCGGSPVQLVYFKDLPRPPFATTIEVWNDVQCQTLGPIQFFYTP